MDKYKEENNRIWAYKLEATNSKIYGEVWRNNDHKVTIKPANICVEDIAGSHLADWNLKTRTIRVSLRLLTKYEWKAVEFVLRHEIAHQIVDEFLDMRTFGHVHGEAFKKACTMVGIEADTKLTDVVMATFNYVPNESPVVDRIRKLLAKGSDNNITREEAQLFLDKAQEIMTKHNVSTTEVYGIDTDDQLFLFRPVGGILKKGSRWKHLFLLCDILQKHYFVEGIWSWTRGGRYYEIMGTPENLDVAEYVYHAILNQGEALYRQYKKEGNRGTRYQFLYNLFKGYRAKLNEQKERTKKKVSEERGSTVDELNALIHQGDKLLKDLYHKRYPDIQHISGNGARYNDKAYRQGKNLTLNTGVNAGGNRGRLITA